MLSASLQSLEEISFLVAMEKGWDEPHRRAVLKEYEGFLRIAAGSQRFERPTLDVDALWHEHILNTMLYVDYCERHFGRYIHHVACVDHALTEMLSEKIGRRIVPLEAQGQMRAAACGVPVVPPNVQAGVLAACGAQKPQPS